MIVSYHYLTIAKGPIYKKLSVKNILFYFEIAVEKIFLDYFYVLLRNKIFYFLKFFP